MALSGKDRRFLRGMGHHLDPVLQLGKEGLSEAFVSAVDQALADHELVKIRVGESAPLERREAASAVAEAAGAELAQVLGRTFLLYRPNGDAPLIALPSGAGKPSAAATAPRKTSPETPRAKTPGQPSDPFSPFSNDAPAPERHAPAPVPKARSKKRSLPHRSSKKALR